MDRRLANTGFTLIELMIVVAIFAVLSTSVVLSVARPGSDSRSDVARFQAAFERVKVEATLSRKIMGLRIDETGFQKLTWDDGWAQSAQKAPWRNDVSVLAPFNRDSPIAFGPSGQVTAFRLRFGEGDTGRVCESDGWSPLTCTSG